MRFKRILWSIAVLSATLLFVTGAHAQEVEYYVLDGFGGVHAGGGAPAIAPASPYFGFDVARDIMYAPGRTGQGYIVLDGWGGVHAGGPIGSILPGPPYFGFDIAKGITYRNIPPRMNGAFSGGTSVLVTSPIFSSVLSVQMWAPDDGYILFTGSAEMFCENVIAGDVRTDISVNVDTVAQLSNYEYNVTIPDCTLTAGGAFERRLISVTHVFFVSAGAHTLHLLARDGGGSLDGRVREISIGAVFVDQAYWGASMPEPEVTAPPSLQELGFIGR